MHARRHLLAPALILGSVAAATFAGELPGRFAGEGLVVGLEYALLDNDRATAAKAAVWAELGMPGMKHIGEAVEWGRMQKGPDAEVDYSRLDAFVREYQKNGFTELTVVLKSHSRWGSKDVRLLEATNPTPKPEHVPRYASWIGGIVERYDHDGQDDLPGLRWPVRYYEIGTEFSSYEPEPVGEYLEMLGVAYQAAHRAFPGVRIAHVAFLTTPVHLDVEKPSDYERVWRTTPRHDEHHGLEDQRAILDRPELFDVINLHNLGDPYEIEHQVRWLAWETKQRGYTKPVMISDTLPTSYVGWGPATVCRGKKLGILAPPATEADRCRLAAFFTRLVDKDPDTLAWTRGFVAADHVQRTIVAAEQGVALINLSFTSDLLWMTGRLARAGAGISGWAGAVRQNPQTGKIHERYPLFHAIRQLMAHLAGYTRVVRLPMADPRARVYRVEAPGGPWWIAWRDPQAVLLPEDGLPSLEVELDVGVPTVTLEKVIHELGQEQPERLTAPSPRGRLSLTLTHTPVYVLPR